MLVEATRQQFILLAVLFTISGLLIGVGLAMALQRPRTAQVVRRRISDAHQRVQAVLSDAERDMEEVAHQHRNKTDWQRW